MTSCVPITARDLATEFASGSLDPVIVAEATLDRIASCEDQSIFTFVTRERALSEARAARQRIRQGTSLSPLDGVPVAWKDLFAFAGLPTTAGSLVLSKEVETADADVVRDLVLAGMVTIGRVNMTEFAFSGIGLNPHFGTPHNPHAADGRIPGGSSSGCGVAVARGLVPISIGTDTSGSVRVPAALNGVVGYKATHGRYPMRGVFPLAETLDSVGVLSRTVDDAILVGAALGRTQPAITERITLRDVTLIVPSNVVFDACESAVADNFDGAISRLARAGVTIRRRPFPAFAQIVELNERLGAIVNAQAYILHRSRIEGHAADQIDRRVVARIRLGERTSRAQYQELLSTRKTLIAEVNAAFLANEFLAFPTVAITAPRIADLKADDEAFFATNRLVLRNTMLGSFLNWCGVTLPSGHNESGLPTAILFSGRQGTDDQLLAFATACESMLAR